jgi:hypothetical protein
VVRHKTEKEILSKLLSDFEETLMMGRDKLQFLEKPFFLITGQKIDFLNNNN